jgi:hypothetical protein
MVDLKKNIDEVGQELDKREKSCISLNYNSSSHPIKTYMLYYVDQ